MTLTPPTPRRERILVTGVAGSGKSTCWLSWAEWSQKTRSERRFFVVDSDYAWDGGRPVDGHLDDIVVPYDVGTVADIKAAGADAMQNVKVDRPGRGGRKVSEDVLVVDMIDFFWSIAQEEGFEAVSGMDFDEFMVKSMVTDTSIAGDYGKNWGLVNKIYSKLMRVVKTWPGHVIAVAPGERVREPDSRGKGGDAQEILDLAGRFKIKPLGQKRLAHDFHTVLLCQETNKGWTLTTLKERNAAGLKEGDEGFRPYLVNKEMAGGFVLSYLKGVAGWKL